MITLAEPVYAVRHRYGWILVEFCENQVIAKVRGSMRRSDLSLDRLISDDTDRGSMDYHRLLIFRNLRDARNFAEERWIGRDD